MKDRDVRQYRIRKNKAGYLPNRILYLDTETKRRREGPEEHHRMDFGWSCYVRGRSDAKNNQETWRFHNNTLELCRYIEGLSKRKTVLYIFAHNIFFDLQVSDFYYYFTRWGWQLGFTYDKGLTYILTIHNQGRHIKCLSTTNYFPFALRQLGQLVGLEKGQADFDNSPREDVITYCRRDAEIIKKGMEYWFKFIEDHDLGKFGLTRASQSFGAFRHRFMGRDINYHRDKELAEYEQKAYLGGRTECFQRGEIKGGPFLSLDINSMYSYVMREFEYPVRFSYFTEYPSLSKVAREIKNNCVVAKVWLDTKEPAYGVKRFHKIIFPIGVFSAYLCTQGMKYALEHDHVLSVESMAVYRKGRIFQPFVDYFYPLKQRYGRENNAIMKRVAKDILNSLYGKFGQKAPVVTEEEDITYNGYWKDEIYDLTTGNIITITKLFNRRFTTEGDEPAKNSMTAIAAHVTEYARFHLWRLIRAVGTDRVLYCDTDSVKIRESDLDKVSYPIDDNTLGALKIEERFEYFQIDGAKQYQTESVQKLKGVPANSQKVGDYDYKYTQFSGQDTHLRRHVDRYFITSEVVKNCKPQYTKGKTLPGGKVIPIVLNESPPPVSLFELPLPSSLRPLCPPGGPS